MKTMNSLKSLVVIFVLAILFSSCDNENEGVIELFNDEDQVTALDTEDGVAEMEQLEVMSEDVFLIASNGRITMDSSTLCDLTVITHDTANNTIYVDFGDTGCEGPDGKLRTGKITIVYTGNFARDHSGQKSITFDGYTVNGNGVDGLVVIGAWTRNGANNWESTVTASNLVFNYVDGTSFTVSAASRTREIIQGDLGRIVAKRISGGSNGINRNGRTYAARISDNEPITFRRLCLRSGNPYPVEGRRLLRIEGRPEFRIDFGLGICDRLAVIQIGDSEPIPIVLR